MWIFCGKFHDQIPRRSDNLPGQKNILQAERFDLLPEFRNGQKIKYEQQKQIVGKHHHLKYRLIGPKQFQ
jgi:hypothetical protein